MLSNDNKKALLIDILGVMVSSIGILLMAIAVPLLSPLIPLTALAFAYMLIRHGRGYFYVALTWYGIGVWVLTGLDVLMIMGLISAVNGYVLGRAYESKMKPSKAIMTMACSTLVIVLLLSEASTAATGVSFVKTYGDTAHKLVNEIMAQPEITQGPMAANMKAQLSTFNQFIDGFLKVLPSYMVLFSVFWGFVTYMASRGIFARLGVEVPPMEKFRNFNYPSSVVPGTLAITAIVYLSSFMVQLDLDIALMNLMVLLIHLFAVQGAAATTRFFTKGEARHGKILSVVTVTLLMINFIMILGLIGLVSLFRIGMKKEV